jgi:hypothetical protein
MSTAAASATSQRAKLHTSAPVDPSPIVPSRSSATVPPRKIDTSATMASRMTSTVKSRFSAFLRTNPRSSSTPYTTFSARPAAPNAPEAP